MEALADVAPTLKEAELRVLFELTRRAYNRPHHSIKASSRELASACKIGRSNAVAALDSLAERAIITTRQGTTTSPSAHQLNFLSTVQIRGPKTGPPPADRWSQNRTTPDPFQDHPGPETEPPPTGNMGVTAQPPAVDISIEPDLIDRLLKANPKKLDPEALARARRWLHGYMTKLGRNHHAHPPDDNITAQFMAIADWNRLEALLDELMAERQEPGYSYAWFVAVAMQRIHGTQPAVLKQRRAALRVVKKGEKEIADDFKQQLLNAANEKVKSLR